MAEMLLAKHNGAFVPISGGEEEDAASKVGEGEVIRVKWSIPRNIKFHRKFFALLRLVLENQDFFTTEKQLLIDLKIRLGYVDPFIRQNGEVIYELRSISFGKMDEAAFSRFYAACLDVIVAHYVVGANPRELSAAAENILRFG